MTVQLENYELYFDSFSQVLWRLRFPGILLKNSSALLLIIPKALTKTVIVPVFNFHFLFHCYFVFGDLFKLLRFCQKVQHLWTKKSLILAQYTVCHRLLLNQYELWSSKELHNLFQTQVSISFHPNPLLFPHKNFCKSFNINIGKLCYSVALWGQAAKADESVLARNQTKDSWTWNLAVPGSGTGRRMRVDDATQS